MMNLFKTKIVVLNKEWQPIFNYDLKMLPRQGEYIYNGEVKQYYKVLNVVYELGKSKKICIIVDKFGKEIPK